MSLSARIKTSKDEVVDDSPYLPLTAVIKDSQKVTPRDTFLTLSVSRPLGCEPGQFVMLGIPGFGEAAISISSAPTKSRDIEVCIRDAGSLTGKLGSLKKNDTIWLRGPMGRGFQMPPKGEDLLFIAGGIGIVPARSMIKAVLKKKRSYGKITILYGINSHDELLFEDEIKEWKKAGAKVLIAATDPPPKWQGHVGVVTDLIPPLHINGPGTTAFIVGPPVMYRYVVPPLTKKGVFMQKTFLSLERRMRCGLGKCGHCLIGGVYSCQCGPVFSLAELADMPGAI